MDMGYWTRLVKKTFPLGQEGGDCLGLTMVCNHDILLHRPLHTDRLVKLFLPLGLFQEDPAWTKAILGERLIHDDSAASKGRALLSSAGPGSLVSSFPYSPAIDPL